jgi:hypothetical protein
MTKVTEELLGQWSDRLWRLNNLYYITDERGQEVKFQPREGQLNFLNSMHNANVILKARQLGFSTLIQLLMLDAAVFNSNVNGAIIAQGLKEAKEIFRTKIKYPYFRLPEMIRERVQLVTDSKDTLGLSNGSQISVGTSMRSTTLTWLHISEFAKICAQNPEKAREIRTGALNAIQPGQAIFIESTAEGREGAFYDICTLAEKRQMQGSKLTPIDFKFHFHPWWKDPKYSMDSEGIMIPPKLEEYFNKLKHKDGVELTDGQKAWYAKKTEIQLDEMKREFPSTPEEAFELAREGTYFTQQLLKAREDGRITGISYNPAYPVYTSWDIGQGDNTAIWFHQKIGYQHRFIHYYENSGEQFQHYAEYLQGMKYVYAGHNFPHDGNFKNIRLPGTLLDDAHNLLTGEIYLVKRIPEKQQSINAARNVLSACAFDEKGCDLGIKRLENYRKEWNENRGTWRTTPLHDANSDGADAFQCFAMSDIAREDDPYEDEAQFIDYEDDRSNVTGY